MSGIKQVKQNTGTNWKWYGALVVFVLALYWPLTLGVFALKNDALTYFLPVRYHISEAIQNGYFPLWSPYLYTGLPLHADMQSGVWNPVVWVFSAVGRYNLTTLHWETLFYYCISAIGFFKLCMHFGWRSWAAFLLACAYCSTGFMLDAASFIPWVTSAAYLPYVLLYFLQLRKFQTAVPCLKLALSLWLLFTAGYPSFFIFSIYSLAFVTFADLAIWWGKRNPQKIYKHIRLLATCGAIWIVLCSPALLSFTDFLAYYQRGAGTTLEQAQYNAFEWQHVSSFLFPSASYKLKGANDISGRNSYVGLFTWLFVIFSFSYKWRRIQWALLIFCVFSFLFSLGPATPVRGLCYHYLPLMNSFRHPSSMRIFVAICLLLLAGFGINEWTEKKEQALLKKSTGINAMILVAAFIAFIFYASDTIALPDVLPLNISNLKTALDNSTAKTWLLVLFCLQAISLFLLWIRQSSSFIALLFLVNMALVAWLAMPFTLLSQYSTRQVNAFINSFADGYPTDSLRMPPLTAGDRIYRHCFGYTAFYEKRLSIQDEVVTPTITTAYGNFLQDAAMQHLISQRPLAFLETGNGGVTLLSAGPNHFRFKVNSNENQPLYFIQQYHHQWRCTVNDTEVLPGRALKAFMLVQIPAGNSIVEFQYRPRLVFIATWTALAALGIVIVFILQKGARVGFSASD